MEIHCLGINHKTAPLDMLESLHMTDQQLKAALARCGCGETELDQELLEMVLLSTCNRVEVYAITKNESPEPLKALLIEASGMTNSDLNGHFYHHQGIESIRHLLRVAAGLDSMVVGEPQILGQVAEAYSNSLKAGASGVVLSKIFHAAIHAGKRARTETEIATNPATISSVAIQFAAEIVPDLAHATVVVLGAGEMAELAVEALRKRGVVDLVVVNRTVSRAEELAERWQASAKSYEQLLEALHGADILISSTGAPHAIIETEHIQEVMQRRPQDPLVILDIAMPRDVVPSVSQLENVHVFDLDNLQHQLQASLDKRHGEIPSVQTILEEEIESFRDWYSSLGIRPLIAEMHQRAEAIRLEEMDRTIEALGSLDAEDKEKINAMTRALVKKILHAPITRLKQQSKQGSAAAYALVTRDLFDLGDGELDPFFPHRRNLQ